MAHFHNTPKGFHAKTSVVLTWKEISALMTCASNYTVDKQTPKAQVTALYKLKTAHRRLRRAWDKETK